MTANDLMTTLVRDFDCPRTQVKTLTVQDLIIETSICKIDRKVAEMGDRAMLPGTKPHAISIDGSRKSFCGSLSQTSDIGKLPLSFVIFGVVPFPMGKG